MTVSPDELTVIADDGHGLSSVDRESIREAAAALEVMSANYWQLRSEVCELQRANTAQCERIKEQGEHIAKLTKKPMEWPILRVRYEVHHIPSWARF